MILGLVIPMGGFIWGLTTDNPTILWLGVAIGGACGLGTTFVRCWRCGKPAMQRRTKRFDVTWTYWGGFGVPDTCDFCGANFEDNGGPSRQRKTYLPQSGRRETGDSAAGLRSVPVRKRILVAFAVIIMNVVGGLLWAIRIDNRLLYLAAAIVLGCLWFVFATRCPRCGKLIYRKQVDASTPISQQIVPRGCRQCGLDFGGETIKPDKV